MFQKVKVRLVRYILANTEINFKLCRGRLTITVDGEIIGPTEHSVTLETS